MQITACYNGGTNAVCSAAQSFCNNNVLHPLAGNFDVRFLQPPSNYLLVLIFFFQVYYVLVENPDPYPPSFDGYLNKLAPTIGAEVKWTHSNSTVYSNFAETGKSIIFSTLYIGGFFNLINSTRRLDAKFATRFGGSDQRRSTFRDFFMISPYT